MNPHAWALLGIAGLAALYWLAARAIDRRRGL